MRGRVYRSIYIQRGVAGENSPIDTDRRPPLSFWMMNPDGNPVIHFINEGLTVRRYKIDLKAGLLINRVVPREADLSSLQGREVF